ncbi:interleukin-31 receptor subunit alpha isoform X2 [Anabas testudineus]|uniref:Fibronectin type-III domain-containing protein n=1 Tax=Anabas testudineus TaxID=64144 RepID=A0A3Q1I1G3_ANATE|nr:interleukin-31 receptor subunit alpha isoform X2 [Anabas testudineus]
MVGCELLNSKCSSYSSNLHFFILCLILAYHTILTLNGEKSRDCSVFPNYQHCINHPAGVQDLDCFSRNDNVGYMRCVWKPGKHTSNKKYTLIIETYYISKNTTFCERYNLTEPSITNIGIYSKRVITAKIFENSESTNCTKAVFRGSTNSLLRCGPPQSVTFRRHSGNLDINVIWQPEDRKVKDYIVRYKTLNSRSWNEVQFQKGSGCVVQNLNSSLAYNVQINCVTNTKCLQCPPSETYTIPSELIMQPEIKKCQDNDVAEMEGKRRIFLTWKFYAEEQNNSYYVDIEKASGEGPRERMNTPKPEITLILSYSAFYVHIGAFNNVSTSPAVSKIITERKDVPSFRDRRLNVTVHNNTAFTVYWEDDLIKTYTCYCLEWKKRGQKAKYKSFYENEKNNWTISNSAERLEPYERYTVTLHTRPYKSTCGLKRVNDSESTYGSTQFYFIEGTPLSAPNISGNVTLNSVMLQWLPIPEEDIRGFLLGYTIHYMESLSSGTETNITVDPELNHYQLEDLKSGTAYEVQVSGFTQAGAGVRSTSYHFSINHQEPFDLSLKLRGIITTFAVVITVLIFGPAIIKRTKIIVWPSIPNPGKSNAMQKIEGTCELELLESINTLKVEEWDTNSLQIVEKEAVISANMLPLLDTSEDRGDSAQMTSNWIQRDTEDVTGGIPPGAITCSNTPQTDLHGSPFAFSSEYTTMEIFNRLMPQGIPGNTDVNQAEESEFEGTDWTVVKPGMDYIRQFSTSPTLDSELSSFL